VASLPRQRVVAVLLAMGFQAVLDDNLLTTYFRVDTEHGVCVIPIDSQSDEVWEEGLVQYLDFYRIDLAEFWNRYDATAES
jgi:hypothetical protein